MTDEAPAPKPINKDFPPFPPEIAEAVAAVMGKIEKLDKDEKNDHGGYKFASIDGFLEAVRPLCAEFGLVIVQDEDEISMKEGTGKDGKASNWIYMRFSFTLAHTSGVTWDYRPKRSIMVPAKMGPQAFGAGQSYTLKNFERSLFKIATGEPDPEADNFGHEREKKTTDPDWRGPMNKTDLQKAMREVDRDVRGSSDEANLDQIINDAMPIIIQARADLPKWIHGDGGDILGLEKLITMTRAEFRSQAETRKLLGVDGEDEEDEAASGETHTAAGMAESGSLGV